MSINTVQASNYGPIFQTTINKANRILDYCSSVGAKVIRVYGYNTTPDHNNKKCVDFMHYGDPKIRDAIINFILANYQSIGVSGMISDRRVMGLVQDGSYRGPVAKWRPYNGPNPHTDHVHVQFTAAPMKPLPTPAPQNPNFVVAVNALRKAIAANAPGTPKNNDATAALTIIEKWAK